MLRRASRLVPGRSNPDGTPFLCVEVKATLSGQVVSSVLKTQLFPYMDLSHAPYGALVSSRTGTDGVVTLDTHLVDRSLTGVPLRNTGLGSGSARLGPARYSIATPLVRLSRVTCLPQLLMLTGSKTASSPREGSLLDSESPSSVCTAT